MFRQVLILKRLTSACARSALVSRVRRHAQRGIEAWNEARDCFGRNRQGVKRLGVERAGQHGGVGWRDRMKNRRERECANARIRRRREYRPRRHRLAKPTEIWLQGKQAVGCHPYDGSDGLLNELSLASGRTQIQRRAEER